MWEWWDNTVATVSGWVGDTWDWVKNQATNATATAKAAADTAAAAVKAAADAATAKAKAAVDTAAAAVKTAADTAAAKVRDALDAAAAKAREAADAAAAKARGALDEGLNKAWEAAEKAAAAARAAADAAGAAAKGAVTTVVAKAGDIINNISLALGAGFDAAMSAVTALPLLAAGFIENITGGLADFKGSNPIALLSSLTAKAPKAMAELNKLGEREEGSIRSTAEELSIRAISMFGSLVGAPLGFLPSIMDVYSAGQGEIFRQDASEVYKPGLLPVGVAVEGRYRHKLEKVAYEHELVRQGISPGRAKILYELYIKLLDINMLRELRLRGHIDDARVITELEAQGYPADDIPKIMELFNVIPGITDLILMAVREAFTPEIAEKFGQYQDYPPELTEWAAKQGLSETWAKRYWASHWGLPSAQIGFEMLHRGIVGMDELKLLLRAQDVMPFWRDKIVDVAYSPYTRVDVRRMHKIGVLDDEAVFTAYADVGFSPYAPGHEHSTVAEAFKCETCRHDSKCGHMLDFTILYNYDPPEDEKTAADKDKAKERDLTKADILTGLRDGLLDESGAGTALGALGYDSDEVAYYLAKVEYQRDKDALEDITRYLHDAYIKGVISYGEVTDELGKLNLPANMTDYYLKVWDLEKIARTNKPTKAELMTFLRKNVIDEETWRVEMVGLGYPNRYIDWYATTV